MLQNISTYIMTEAPDYCVALAYGDGRAEHLVQWEGKGSQEFNRTIGSLGTFAYRCESYVVGARVFTEHVWERIQEAHAAGE